MRKEDFCEVLGDINENYVKEAKATKVSKWTNWVKWGAMAACLCLVVGFFALINNQRHVPQGDAGVGVGIDGTVPGGTMPEGVDPVMASIAVYPASESIEDVENATFTHISKEDAYTFDELGQYLPTTLPEGYEFERADLYETTMKNGVKYNLLRTHYMKTVDGDVEDENAVIERFAVFVMNYKPRTDKTIYMVDTLPRDIEGTFHVSFDNVYLGFTPDYLTYDEIMLVLNSINPVT